LYIDNGSQLKTRIEWVAFLPDGKSMNQNLNLYGGGDSDDFFAEVVKKTSRAESIAEIISEGIGRGYWKPEDRINDLELSERLGVSRLTVREALSRLAERRILERKHWKGYTVRKFTWEEIDNLIDVRLALEELALRKASEKNPSELVARMSASLNASKKVVEAGDFKGFFKTDYVFHQILYSSSENPWIEDILSDLYLVINISRHLSQADHIEDVARSSIKDHERILAALKKGHVDEGVENLRKHLNNHRERVRKEFEHNGLLSVSKTETA